MRILLVLDRVENAASANALVKGLLWGAAAVLFAREADTAVARQAAQDKIEATQADKARKAEEGEKRKAADAERLRQKQEAHARKQAEKMREAERRAAEAAAK